VPEVVILTLLNMFVAASNGVCAKHTGETRDILATVAWVASSLYWLSRLVI
jgi:hypothetical protein